MYQYLFYSKQTQCKIMDYVNTIFKKETKLKYDLITKNHE